MYVFVIQRTFIHKILLPGPTLMYKTHDTFDEALGFLLFKLVTV